MPEGEFVSFEFMPLYELLFVCLFHFPLVFWVTRKHKLLVVHQYEGHKTHTC